MKPKIIYYEDELNDEFSTAEITPKPITGDYQYIDNSKKGRFLHFFWYKIVATPLAKIYMKLYFGHRIYNKAKLKPYLKSGYYMYGNHTHFLADALIPTMINMPKDAYVIVHPNNVSMPYLGRVTPSLGALPLPDDLDATRHFIDAINTRFEEGNAIVIYPEAHIWPYYTGIRPFTDRSFRYPANDNAPVFCFTNTYQKRRFRKTPRIVTYIDGPFFADNNLKLKEKKVSLREQVYNAMCKRSKKNNITLVKYIKKETPSND